MKYAKLLAVAFIASVPIAWMLINGWQQNFVKKVGISGLEFIVAFVVIAALTASIVSLMSWKAIKTQLSLKIFCENSIALILKQQRNSCACGIRRGVIRQ